jgi:imidazolonepropionase-like amidohydrolase
LRWTRGRVAEVIRALAATGMRPQFCLAAGSWSARAFLRLPGQAPRDSADVVIYEQDARVDLSCLDHPSAIVLRGRIVSR